MASAQYFFRSSFSRWSPLRTGAARLLLGRSVVSSVECVGCFSRWRAEGSLRRHSGWLGLALGRRLVRGKQQVAAYYTKPKRKGISGEALLMVLGGSIALGTAGVFFMGRPEEGLDGRVMEDEFSKEPVAMGYLKRARQRMKDFTKMYTEPAHETLLPDPLPYPHQPPYTLVLEMKDVLVHSEYDRSEGWRLKKRPGIDYLFRSLVGRYEIILFTCEVPFVAEPVIAQLDPERFIMYHLYRDSTKYINGQHIKDLTNLNRDMSKVVVVDTDPRSCSYHPSNAITLKQWEGQDGDTALFELAHFLRALADHRVADFRPVLDSLKSQGEDVLVTFRLNQARLGQEEERRKEGRKGSGTTSPWTGLKWGPR